MEAANLENAYKFLAQVKQTGSYRLFTDILMKFDGGKIDANSSISQLRTLFAAHPDLLRAIDNFRLKSAPERESLSIAYVSKVKERFEKNPETYRKFLDAIVTYHGRNANTKDLCLKIVDIFFGHADLIDEFQGFFRDREENLWREVEECCSFAIDEAMVEIEVMWSRLRTSIECAENALRVAPPELSEFVRGNFVGTKLMGIQSLYGECSQEVIASLKKEPERALPVILEALRNRERAITTIRSDALHFLGQYRVLSSKRGTRESRD